MHIVSFESRVRYHRRDLSSLKLAPMLALAQAQSWTVHCRFALCYGQVLNRVLKLVFQRERPVPPDDAPQLQQ